MIQITRSTDIEAITREYGILPFFKNRIPGFSIEENTPDYLWFTEEDGPWEWKGPIIRRGNCAYGKLWQGKAAYVSMDLLPDLINLRKSLKLTTLERKILQTIQDNESITTPELKEMFGKDSQPKAKRTFAPVREYASSQYPAVKKANARQSVDVALIHLQMAMKIVVADFEYRYTKQGVRYGWGIARYSTPELLYELDWKSAVNGRSPAQSQKIICQRLAEKLPHVPEADLKKILVVV